jgi:hypothetical protein
MNIERRVQNAEYTFWGAEAQCTVVNNEIFYKWHIPQKLHFNENQRVQISTIGCHITHHNMKHFEVMAPYFDTNDECYTSTDNDGHLSIFCGDVNGVKHFDKYITSYPAKNMFQGNSLVLKIVLRFEDYSKVNNIDNTLNTKNRFFIKFNVFEDKPILRDDTREISKNDLTTGKIRDNNISYK